MWSRLSKVDDIVIEGPPEAFDLAIGLRPIGPGVTVFDVELGQQGGADSVVRLRRYRGQVGSVAGVVKPEVVGGDPRRVSW